MQTRQASLPREIAKNTWWLSACLHIREGARILHNHNSCFLIIGSKASVLIDTGMPFGWHHLKREIAQALGGKPLDYVFPTHPEGPHMGNIEPLLDVYPGMKIVGDLRNYHLYFPRDTARFVGAKAGDALDLGDRRLIFQPAIVHDLPNTLWAYDPDEQILFVGDAYPYTHDHEGDQCGLGSEELPGEIKPEDTGVVISRALNWARHVDATPIVAKLRAWLAEHPVKLVAPAHGGVITNVADITDVFEKGLARARLLA